MLGRLLQGIGQFQKNLPERVHAIFDELKSRQKPDTFFITCSDSRVVPSLMTSTDPGELFTLRNIGNMVPDHSKNSTELSVAAAVEYALAIDVSDIIVCGHSDCGAMKGLLDPIGQKTPPRTSSWLNQHAHSVLEEMNKEHIDLSTPMAAEIAAKKNVLAQLAHLRNDPLIIEQLALNKIHLHGWYFNIETHEISIYVPQYNDFVSFEQAVAHSITVKEAMNYLEGLSHPQTITEYHDLLRLLSESKGTTQAVWPHIKEKVTKKLWEGFGNLYSSIDDPKFTSMLNLGAQVELPHLKDFHENIECSKGYKQLCSQIMRRLCFFTPTTAQEEVRSHYEAPVNKQ